MDSPAQLGLTAGVVLALVVVAVFFWRRHRRRLATARSEHEPLAEEPETADAAGEDAGETDQVDRHQAVIRVASVVV